jgi:hypothetical protein
MLLTMAARTEADKALRRLKISRNQQASFRPHQIALVKAGCPQVCPLDTLPEATLPQQDHQVLGRLRTGNLSGGNKQRTDEGYLDPLFVTYKTYILIQI